MRVARWSVLAALTLAGLSGGGPALAGGGGGVCYEPPAALDAGWVAVGDNCFSPNDIEIVTGNAVRWGVVGQVPHTVTFDTGPDAGQIPPDGVAVQFNSPGTYTYFCSFHNGMTGTVRATGSTVGGPALEVLGSSTIATSGGRTAVLRDNVPMRVEFSPLTALVVLAVGLPISFGAAARLVGFARTPADYRLRVPWESRRPPKPAARR